MTENAPKTVLQQVKDAIAERDAGHALCEDEDGYVIPSEQDEFDKVTAEFESEISQLIDGLVDEIENPRVFTVIVKADADDTPNHLFCVTVAANTTDKAQEAAIDSASKSFMERQGWDEEKITAMEWGANLRFTAEGIFVGHPLRSPETTTEIDLTDEEN
jgi:hypothetical protein